MALLFRGRTLVVAFEGWNDAAEAASMALRELANKIGTVTLQSIDPEEYYDFQFSRPLIARSEDGARELIWPTVELLGLDPETKSEFPGFVNTFLLMGAEPSRRWRSFVQEIWEILEDRDIDSVVFLGSMLADVPHTRPIQVYKSSPVAQVQQAEDAEPPQYEGPVGIMSVLAKRLEIEHIPFISLWASVPHYVQNTPSPKASLALLGELQSLLGVTFDTGDLADQAFEWERGIDEIAEQDEEMAGYIVQLETRRDNFDSQQVSGDILAMEFERYLNPDDDEKSAGGQI